MKGWMGLCLALIFAVLGCQADETDLSPDGHTIARAGKDGLTVKNLLTQASHQVTKKQSLFPRWSPTGNLLAYESDGWSWLYHPRSAQAKHLRKGLQGPFAW